MNKFLFIILFTIPYFGYSQVVSDAKLWTGVSISKRVNDFEFSFSEDIRFDENMTHIDKVFSEFGAEYKIVKGIYSGVNYRFSRDNEYSEKTYNMRHRFDVFLNFKYKYENFRFSYRTKLQSKSSTPEENRPTFSRNKFAVKYKLENDFTPFVSYEFYYQFNEEKIINRTRFSMGSIYKINKKSALKFFYIFENRFNVKTLKHNHIYGISYSFEL
ncbi:MAG: DUF2490 domain-containing protein [Vicingaceae bacterium]